MKIQQLKALVAVVHSGGIRAAARELNLSQAAITKSLKQLEEECGVALLLRRSRGVDLTPAGERLLERARLITRQIELAHEDLQQSRGEDMGVVRVGISPFLTLTALGEAFNWFRSRYAHVQIQLIEGLMTRVLPCLREGSLDIAVVVSDVGELNNNEFHRTHLYNSRQFVVAREGHPVLSNPTALALVEYEWVYTAPIVEGNGNRQAAMFAAAGVKLPERVVQCETLAAMTLLRNADLISIFPEQLLGHPESRGIVVVPTTQLHPCEIEISLLAPPDAPLTPAAEYFAHCLMKSSGG
ncbi:MAG: LysR substrate-binding domain-containing protein [Burkholderiaceae bacterium]|nr:LysR substrate-binding domain-containing protein [Burkholderiaceae bacterium]